MHNGDKVGASKVGKLIWMNMKVDINPFPEKNDLISKAKNLATHFLYGSERYKQLWKLTNEFSGVHGTWVKLCIDLNGTRISVHQPLLYSIGCNIIGLKSYTMPGNTHGIEDWNHKSGRHPLIWRLC